MKIEHLALQVKEPETVASWYCKNLGLKIKRHIPGPPCAYFLADDNDRMMLEIYYNPKEKVPDYPNLSPVAFHLAFLSEDVPLSYKAMISAGATPLSEPIKAESGDEFAMLRDPWGLPIQFVKRKESMVKA
ncbi:MAG: VOC family protein [Candidatus Brocadiae bacterium]|nr:VOC family protein [Candidatus Brocadiia bacterium]